MDSNILTLYQTPGYTQWRCRQYWLEDGKEINEKRNEKRESVPITNHLQINSCSTSMNVVKNQTTSIKKKKQPSRHQRAQDTHRKGLVVFYFFNKIRPGNNEVSEFSSWVVSQRTGGWKKPPSFSVELNKRRLVEFLFPSVDFWFVQSCFACIMYSLLEFLSRFMWILNPLPGELCEPEPWVDPNFAFVRWFAALCVIVLFILVLFSHFV